MITNFVDIDQFTYKERNCEDFDHMNCIFVGRFTEAKNIDHFLEAIKLIVDKNIDIRVNFYGHSHEEKFAMSCNKKE